MHGWTSAHFFLRFSLFGGLPQDQCTLHIIAVTHIIFIFFVQYIIITSWDNQVALMSIGLVETDGHQAGFTENPPEVHSEWI